MKAPIDNFRLLKHPEGSVTQWFGENPDLYGRWGLAGHNGIDIVAPHGTPLYAVEEGYVLDVENDPKGYGKHIRFISRVPDGDGWLHEWTYAHNSDNHVEVGDNVSEGQHIADMGNTGFVISGSTPWWKHNPYAGTHLHIGLRKVKRDPRGWSYPDSDVKIEVKDYDNGYKGAIDPYLYLLNAEQRREFSQTLLSLQSAINTIMRLFVKRKT